LANIVKKRLLVGGSFITWGVGWDCTMSNGECYPNALCQHEHRAANTRPVLVRTHEQKQQLTQTRMYVHKVSKVRKCLICSFSFML
jgi:hypothetical protein